MAFSWTFDNLYVACSKVCENVIWRKFSEKAEIVGAADGIFRGHPFARTETDRSKIYPLVSEQHCRARAIWSISIVQSSHPENLLIPVRSTSRTFITR